MGITAAVVATTATLVNAREQKMSAQRQMDKQYEAQVAQERKLIEKDKQKDFAGNMLALRRKQQANQIAAQGRGSTILGGGTDAPAGGAQVSGGKTLLGV
jgi:malic enzyme